MRRDWMVWLGCFFLFGSGAVWAQVPIKSDFFVVDNVHDLFEILGALATVIAVCVAAANINTWKHQVNASADLELARKVVTAIHRYKSKVMAAWGWAEFSAAQLNVGQPPTSDLSESVNDAIQNALDENDSSHLELMDLLLQCKSAWRLDFGTDQKVLELFADRCSLVSKSYILRARTYNLNHQLALRSENVMRNHWLWFEENNCSDYGQAAKHVEGLLSKLEHRIEEKLLLR
jgi:hypothetical protein